MKTVIIARAIAAPEGVTISFEGTPPEADKMTTGKQTEFYTSQAQALFDILRLTLPAGTLVLLGRMLLLTKMAPTGRRRHG